MSLNSKEINTILTELDLSGYFIQQITQPSFSALILHLYKTRSLTLFIGLSSGACRIHSLTSKIEKTKKPLRFMELLRAKIKGAKIVRVEHINHDRIIKLELLHAGENMALYIRLWSSAANIILTDKDDIIIDTFYRRPKKNEISGAQWELPVPTKKQKEYQLRDYDPNNSFNSAIEAAYAHADSELSYEMIFPRAEKLYHEKAFRLEQVIENLSNKIANFENSNQLRHYGDLLLANAHTIAKGAKQIELQDYSCENHTLRILLNPLKSPQENAQHFYAQYKKAQSGLQAVRDDLNTHFIQKDRLNEDFNAIQEARSVPAVKKFLEKYRSIQQQHKINAKKQIPGLQFFVDGWQVLVGRNARENDALLRKHTRGNDYWLHVRHQAGGYVFIKAQAKKNVPLSILLAAGNLAVFYSKARTSQEADVYYTQVKYLRRAKGAKLGTVLPTQEKNLFITLNESILKNLQEKQINQN